MLSLRRADVQAKASVVASGVSLVLALGLIPMVFRHFQPDSLMIYYNRASLRMPMIVACGGVAIMCGMFGFYLGFVSAGHRRNDRPGLSWAGFFIGAAAICATLILLAIFWFWKENVGL